ncbi:ring-cleaving dioxygenase [Pseudoroseicyclus tamaricis]|uniref:Ring-cleaving dioxygenase n=1 Tax=Pseudoroseicyclus tamaricis TaxID=2705421 RepID=A0A6B2JVS7_9RHOB|nr:ring-cleaving dioxygenase [Pseudoroseicyclus tamaricis]NDV02607.1 ring-cleaving dioxygenase [Pseudoroseicyclus tamaricis]
MFPTIPGLHHITSIASGARENDAFYTTTLGLRRVKKTVNFDAPDVYHLYFGDKAGAPGTIWTSFPFPNARRGTAGTGTTVRTAFAVPQGSLDYWEAALGGRRDTTFGAEQLVFEGPDGEGLALVAEAEADGSEIQSLHSVTLSLRDGGPEAEILSLMGFEEVMEEGRERLFSAPGDAHGKSVILATRPDEPAAKEGAGSVHHVAFRVADEPAQLRAREALEEAGIAVTEVRDRQYFRSIYFRTPGGVLFEIATDGPGFDADEPAETMGTALKLPGQHEHLRARLEEELVPLD